MKRKIFSAIVMFLFITVSAFAADLKKDIVGKWSADFSGITLDMEFKENGDCIQKMKDFESKGKYTVQGNKYTVEIKKQKTVFTVIKSDGKTMTVQRDKDGSKLVYKRK